MSNSNVDKIIDEMDIVMLFQDDVADLVDFDPQDFPWTSEGGDLIDYSDAIEKKILLAFNHL